MDESIPKNNYTLMNIYEKISKLTTEISLVRQEQENFKEAHKELAQSVCHIKKIIDGYEKRFEKIDNLTEYKGAWLKGFERNWWKLLLVLAPLIAGAFEMGMWLRNLPPPTL